MLEKCHRPMQFVEVHLQPFRRNSLLNVCRSRKSQKNSLKTLIFGVQGHSGSRAGLSWWEAWAQWRIWDFRKGLAIELRSFKN